MNKSLSNDNSFTDMRSTVQHPPEQISKHIDFLKSLDTAEFYTKEEPEIRAYASEAIQGLISLGCDATRDIVLLLNTEFTWSCFFALTILRETKDPQAIPALIEFLRKESDDALANEEAMFALQDMGDPCINLLIEELQKAFENKRYHTYLVGALTGIIGPTPYDFMVRITKDYIAKPLRYKSWFCIDDFTYNFVKQGRTEALVLLQQLLEIKTLLPAEKREIQDTISALQDPAGYEKKIEHMVNGLQC